MPKQFKFYEEAGDAEPRFTCTLKGRRCTSKKADGTRCGNQTVFGVPVCWRHLLKENSLRIGDSRIEGAGKGLFCSKTSKIPENVQRSRENVVFRAQDKLVEYIGDKIDQSEVARRYANRTAPYGLEPRSGELIDGACLRGIGAFVNHKSRTQANCRFSKARDGKIWIVATKPIYLGDESTVNYGSEYDFNDGSRHTTR